MSTIKQPKLLNIFVAKLIRLIEFCDARHLDVRAALPELRETGEEVESLLQIFKAVAHKKSSASFKSYLEFLAGRRPDADKIKEKLQQIASSVDEPNEAHKKSDRKLLVTDTQNHKRVFVAKPGVSDYLQTLQVPQQAAKP